MVYCLVSKVKGTECPHRVHKDTVLHIESDLSNFMNLTYDTASVETLSYGMSISYLTKSFVALDF
jgi:hypothetical protein